ncbi:MAG: glycoside hydrolase family 2 protein, partial [Clostridia bacterium]|nr:glycoside hydrolase family 2 protein [Clostridia bacterium]
MKQLLNENWTICKKGSTHTYSASIPGSVIDTYYKNSVIDDPYFRDNEKIAYDISRDDFIFTKSFVISEEQLESDYLFLCFEGIDTISDIYLNDKKIASTDNMHRTYRFDIRDESVPGTNQIKVILYSPVQYIEKKWKNRGYAWGVNARDGYQYIRKAHYMFGWDWGPAIPDQGIFRDVYLETYNKGYIEDIYITQKHNKDSVDIHIRKNIVGDHKMSLRLDVFDEDHVLITSELVSDKPVIISQPHLWWPREYGEQYLYTFSFTLLHDNEAVDSKKYSIGLRTMEVKREKDVFGESFTFMVNGIEIFAKGANYIPEDCILPRLSRERTEKVIEMAVKANFNSIRVWGGGIYPADYFFDLCDQHGLMVWHDFMFACAEYRLDDQVFVDTIKEEIKDNVRRLRHHASIALWCGNNEMEWLWKDEQTEGRKQEQMDEYLVLFEDIIQKIAEKEDPDRLYWPASPSSGGGFDEPNAENRGDVHYWDVWHKEKPFQDYRKYYFRFCSEFGFQSFPCLKTVETFTLKEDQNVFSYIMESHQKNDGANGRILSYLSKNFRYPNDFDSLLYVSQLLQAEAIKYGVEHWRRNRGRCMGSIYWQYNDCWPGPSWSSIDCFNRWKALHYFAKKFYAPTLISVEEEGFKATIHVSNESKHIQKGTVAWSLETADRQVLDHGKHEITVSEHTDFPVCHLDFQSLLSDFESAKSAYLKYEFKNENNELFSSSIIFVPQKYFDFKKPLINYEVSQTDNRYVITLRSNTYAKYVEISFNDFDG